MPNYKPSVRRMGESLGRYYYSEKWEYAQFSTSLRGSRLREAVHQGPSPRVKTLRELETWYMVRRKHNKELRDLYNRVLRPIMVLNSAKWMLYDSAFKEDEMEAPSSRRDREAYHEIENISENLWKEARAELRRLYPDLYPER